MMGLPEKIIEKVDGVLSGQREIKNKLIEHEIGFFGRMADLPVVGQIIRTLTRPCLSWFVALLFGTGCVLYWIYIFKFKEAMPEFIPSALTEAFKWVIGFWFTGRTIQETAKILTKTSKIKREEQKLDLKARRQEVQLKKQENKSKWKT